MGRIRRFDEQHVLHSATEVFWSTGFAGTSVDDIMQATGLGKGSLYGAFGDKRTLFHRAFDGYCDQVTAAFHSRLSGQSPSSSSSSSSAGRLRTLFDRILAYADGSQPPPRACLLAKATAELAATDPEVAARSRQTFEAMSDILHTELTQAQADGDLPADLDTRRTAHHLLVVFRGIEAMAEAGTDHIILRDAADTALAQAGLTG